MTGGNEPGRARPVAASADRGARLSGSVLSHYPLRPHTALGASCAPGASSGRT
jgi:hypothetical protein